MERSAPLSSHYFGATTHAQNAGGGARKPYTQSWYTFTMLATNAIVQYVCNIV